MQRLSLALFSVAALWLGGCSSANGDTDDGTAASSGDPSSGTGSGPGGGTDPSGGKSIELPFDPSNLPPGYAPAVHSSVTISPSCEGVIDTSGEVLPDCAEISGDIAPVFERVMQPDGDELSVLVVDELWIKSGAQVKALGDRPLLILAQGAVRIDGALDTIDGDRQGSGAAVAGSLDGLGPGGGKGGTEDAAGASGAAHCAVGGRGGGAMGGGPATAYGNATIVPLAGGSSGGSILDWGGGAAGGAAIQIVSAVSISVGQGGVINVGGHGATWMAGGGSGGLLLLEAPTVTVTGVLAANGGGGGASAWTAGPGQNGLASDTAAKGGYMADCSGATLAGGPGGAAAKAQGSDGEGGVDDCGDGASGGGGGVGRIRINTTGGAAEVTGMVSPSLGGDCSSQGALGG